MNNQLRVLLISKNINLALYEESKIAITDVEKIAELLSINAYSRPYRDSAEQKEEINRFHHGLQHALRVAFYILISANLYLRRGDNIRIEDLHLLTIAALFHDVTRENDGEDKWDFESALLCFYFLKDVLKVDAKKAAEIAEAIANKDQKDDVYFKLVESSKTLGEYEWRETKGHQKTLLQKIMHDADSYDMPRACNCFDATYLDFWKDHAQSDSIAFEEMARVVVEIKSLIAMQGDARLTPSIRKKLPYNKEGAYNAVRADICDAEKFPYLAALYAKGDLLPPEKRSKSLCTHVPYSAQDGFTQQNLRAAMDEGRLFARGLEKSTNYRNKISRHGEETQGATEIRKTYRRKGTATRTVKSNRFDKEGNPGRSICGMGWGRPLFHNVGFMLINPDPAGFSLIKDVDADTGRHQKKYFVKEATATEAKENAAQLAQVLRKQKMGGSIRYPHEDGGIFWSHSEMTYHITQFDAVYFSDDPCDSMGNWYRQHSAFLQALFLQQEHHLQTGKQLPMVCYSAERNSIELVDTVSDEKIIEMWHSIVTDYLDSVMNSEFEEQPDNLSVIQIKQRCLFMCANGVSADAHYSKELQAKIDDMIANLKDEMLRKRDEDYQTMIQQRPGYIFYYPQYFKYFMQIPEAKVNDKAKSAIKWLVDKVVTENRPFGSQHIPNGGFHGSESLAYQTSLENRIGVASAPSLPDAARAYLLAVKFGLHDQALKLQKMAAVFAPQLFTMKDGLGEISHKIFFSGIIELLGLFDLQSQFENELAVKLSERIARIQVLSKSVLDVHFAWEFIAYCFDKQLPLNHAMRESIRTFVGNQTRNSLDLNLLQYYLTAAHGLQIRTEQQKQIALSSISSCIISTSDAKHIFSGLENAGLLDDEDIITALVTRFAAATPTEFSQLIQNLRERSKIRWSEQLEALVKSHEQMVDAFHRLDMQRFVMCCTEQKAMPHLVFKNAKFNLIIDFLSPLLWAEDFMRSGKLFQLSAEQEKILLSAVVEKIKSDLMNTKKWTWDHPVHQYCRILQPMLTKVTCCFWKKAEPNPGYHQAILLIGSIARQEENLSAAKFVEYLDQLMQKPMIMSHTRQDFQNCLKAWRDVAKLNCVATQSARMR